MGYSEKEVSDSYAYYCVDTFWEAKGICEDGFEVGNVTTSCLGNPKLGKYCLSKNIIDVHIFPTFFSSLYRLQYQSYACVQLDVNVASFSVTREVRFVQTPKFHIG